MINMKESRNYDARNGQHARHDETSTKMQKEMAKAQEALNEKEFIGEATNQLVTATFTGDRTMKDLTIKEDVVDPEDVDMLQDLVIMAVNDALVKIEKETEATLGKYTKGMPGF